MAATEPELITEDSEERLSVFQDFFEGLDLDPGNDDDDDEANG